MRKSAWMAVIAGAIAALAAPAQGALVTWLFDGTVNFVTDTHAVLDGSVFVGTPLSGVITYDTSLVDGIPADPTIGEYYQAAPPGAFAVHVGNDAMSLSAFRIVVYDNFVFPMQPPFDEVDFNVTELVAFPGVVGASISQFDLAPVGADTTMLADDSLPSAPLEQSSFQGGGRSRSSCWAVSTGKSRRAHAPPPRSRSKPM